MGALSRATRRAPLGIAVMRALDPPAAGGQLTLRSALERAAALGLTVVAPAPASDFARYMATGTAVDPTLFQDAAGTTPVTAMEQPVGLRLDLSKGLVRGVELVTNGGFADASSWTLSGSAAIGSGTLNLSAASAQGSQSIAIAANKSYELTFDVSNATAGLYLNAYIGGSARFGLVSGVSNGPKRTVITAGSTNTLVVIQNDAGSTGTCSVDNVSVRELPGHHASQSTAASRPVLTARKNLYTSDTQDLTNAAWTKRNGVTIGANAIAAPDGTLTADKMIEPTGTAVKEISTQGHAAVAGSPVTFSVHAKAGERSRIRLAFNGTYFAGGNSDIFDLSSGTIVSTGASTTSSMVSLGNGWYRCSVTQTAHTGVSGGTALNFITLVDGASSAAYTGDGLSGVYLWGLQAEAGSTATRYQRVTTATDYDWQGFPLRFKYDGVDDFFSTGSINFTATDKVTVVAGVTKLSDAAIGAVCELSVDTNTNAGTFGVFAPSSAGGAHYGMRSKGSSAADAFGNGTFGAPHTGVVTGTGNISGDSTALRVNGVQATSSAGDQGTGNFGNYPLYIGRRGGTSLPFNGEEHALFVFGGLLPDYLRDFFERYTADLQTTKPAPPSVTPTPAPAPSAYAYHAIAPLQTWGPNTQIAQLNLRTSSGGTPVTGTYSASSQSGTLTGPEKAFDGNASTCWEPAIGDTAQKLIVQTAQPVVISHFDVTYMATESAFTDASMAEFDLLGSSNGQDWTVLKQVRGQARAASGATVSYALVDAPAPAATVPGKPTIGTVVASSGSVQVPYTAPASDGGSPILDYRITASTGQTFTGITANPATVSMPNGVAATFTIAARSEVGYGAESNPSNSVTPSAEINPDVGFDNTADMTLQSGWTSSGGLLTRTNTGTSTSALRNATLPAGTYKTVMVVSSVTSGGVAARVGSSGFGTYRTAPGTYTQNVTIAADGTYFGLGGNSAFAGSVDSLSIERIS